MKRGKSMTIPSLEERQEHLEKAQELFEAIRGGERSFSEDDWGLLQRCAACYAAVIIMSIRGDGSNGETQ
jgi:hypothetical protein